MVCRAGPDATCIRAPPLSGSRAEEGGPRLLITPDSVLLYPGGRLEVLTGVHDEAKSKVTAPEMSHASGADVENVSYILLIHKDGLVESFLLPRCMSTPLEQLYL